MCIYISKKEKEKKKEICYNIMNVCVYVLLKTKRGKEKNE